jgi:hypothetical protein
MRFLQSSMSRSIWANDSRSGIRPGPPRLSAQAPFFVFSQSLERPSSH